MQAAIRAFETLFAGATANYLGEFSTAVDLTTNADYFRPPFQRPAIGRNHHLRVNLFNGRDPLSFEFNRSGAIKMTGNPFSGASGRLQVQVLQDLARYLNVGVDLPQLQSVAVTLSPFIIPRVGMFDFSDRRLDAWFNRIDVVNDLILRLNSVRPATWTEPILITVGRHPGNNALIIGLGRTSGSIIVHTSGFLQCMGVRMPNLLQYFLPHLVKGMLHLSGLPSNDYDVEMALMALEAVPRGGPRAHEEERDVRARVAGDGGDAAIVIAADAVVAPAPAAPAVRVDAVADQEAQVGGDPFPFDIAAAAAAAAAAAVAVAK